MKNLPLVLERVRNLETATANRVAGKQSSGLQELVAKWDLDEAMGIRPEHRLFRSSQ